MPEVNKTAVSYTVEQVLVIGLGLIGGSLAAALKKRGFCRQVAGYDPDSDALQQGLDLEVIDIACTELSSCVAQSDLIVLAVPVKATEAVLQAIAPYLCPHTLITDVGSTKGNVIAAIRQVFDAIPPGFVPGHPIAGSEKSGVGAADAELFVRHKVILTPLPESSSAAVQHIARMWQSTGAEVLQMDIERHDEVLAATSHLPHILAFSLVDTLAKEEESRDIFRYAAGGFRDFTRIAASDPIMWHDICVANRTQLLSQIDTFTQGLTLLRSAIAEGDTPAMLGIFTRAKAAREHFSKMLAGTAYSQKDNKEQVTFHTRKSSPLTGDISVPGDQSISHRAVILGALAEGVTHIKGFLEGEDSLATIQALRDMGVVIEGPHLGQVSVYGVGLDGLTPPPAPLYLGGAATSMRLLCGLLAAQPFSARLEGGAALDTCQVTPLIDPLQKMGAVITCTDGKLPLSIQGRRPLKSLNYAMPVASAQIKSALLLAGLYADSQMCITEPVATRNHTEIMLGRFGVEVKTGSAGIEMAPGQRLKATDIQVPGDLSLAALFILAGCLVPASALTLKGVGVNPARTGIIEIMQLMGADIRLENITCEAGESVADIMVRQQPLQGAVIPENLLYRALDELPVLFAAAVFAQGETRLKGLEALQHRAGSDLAALLRVVKQLGAPVACEHDEIVITGQAPQKTVLACQHHPRIAMAFAVAGAASDTEISIEACERVTAVFPDFAELAHKAGLKIHKEET